MTEIEHRVETRAATPDYSNAKFSPEAIAAGKHRSFIGGHWDTHGHHQLDFLEAQGLKPEHRFLDVGCGSFRAGRHLVDYLEPGHYYGIDASQGVMQAGYDVELTDEQRARLPIANLRANDRFDGDFGVQFDFAIAQSVFTHVSLNHVRLCLYRVAKVMAPGGVFYATFNERASNFPLDRIDQKAGRKPFLTERNLFWYYRSDLAWAATIAPWTFQYIGDWGHPMGQRMVAFTRRDAAMPTSVKGGANPAAVAPSAPWAHHPMPRGSGRLADAQRFLYRARRWTARHIAP